MGEFRHRKDILPRDASSIVNKAKYKYVGQDVVVPVWVGWRATIGGDPHNYA